MEILNRLKFWSSYGKPSIRQMLHNMSPIISSIEAAELKIFKQKPHDAHYFGKQICFQPDGDNSPVYTRTSEKRTLYHLINMEREGILPAEINAADAGAGFGGFCFAAREFAANFPSSIKHFNITGFEYDPDIYKEAQNIKDLHGIKNVRFNHADFLNIDIKDYNLIFVYKPFLDDFDNLMSRKLEEAKKGTLVIYHLVSWIDAFYPKSYKKVYSPLFLTNPCGTKSGLFLAVKRK